MKFTTIILIILALYSCASSQEIIEFAVEGVSDSLINDEERDRDEAIIDAKLNAIANAGVSIEAAVNLGNFNLKKEWTERMALAAILPDYQIVEFGYGEDSLYYVAIFGKSYIGDIISLNLEGDKKYRLARHALNSRKVGALAQFQEIVNSYPHSSSADDALFDLMIYGEFSKRQHRFAQLLQDYPQSPLLDSAKTAMEVYDFKVETFDGMDFVLMPPGMLETPDGLVEIKPFYIQTTEMPQKTYDKYAKNKSVNKGENQPVEFVSVNDIDKFLKKLHKEIKTEYYRLPTKEEWEYACRCGVRTAYSFGDYPEELGEYAWYLQNADQKTHPVTRKKPNWAGLYDFHGNVWEWCRNASSDGESKAYIRGGSWNSTADEAVCSIFKEKPPGKKFADVGFRLVRDFKTKLEQ